MREIKFRAWNTVGKKMHPDSDWVYEWCMIKEQHESGLIVLLQYTGLKDANGVEIYEGDIVSDHVGIGEVKYSEKKAAYKVSYTDGVYAKWFIDYMNRLELNSIEVIGNIYENPELLK